MNNYLWFLFIVIDVFLIVKTGYYQNHHFWIFLFLITFFDFFEEFGNRGKGNYSFIIRFIGFILFLLSIILSFVFAGWKIAILIFVTFFLVGKNLNSLFVNKIFSVIKDSYK